MLNELQMKVLWDQWQALLKIVRSDEPLRPFVAKRLPEEPFHKLGF
jgi:hypothetical protein